MSKGHRRYEVLLPLRFNDGTPVPRDLIADTMLELEEEFGAVSNESQTILGQWRHQGKSYSDQLTRVFVDVPDTAKARRFFQNFKRTLKARFKQLEIWVVTYPVETL